MSEAYNKIDQDDLDDLRNQGLVPLSALAVFSVRSLVCLAVLFVWSPIVISELRRVWQGGTYSELANVMLPGLLGLLAACLLGSLIAVLAQTKGLFSLRFVGFQASRLGFRWLSFKDYFTRLIVGLFLIAGAILFAIVFIYIGIQRALPLLNRNSLTIPQEAGTLLQAYGFMLLLAFFLLAISAWLARRILFMIQHTKK